VTLQTPFEGAKDAANLATAGADPLRSQFTPSYGMVLNLLQNHTLEQAKELVERSFGQYERLKLKPQYEALKELQAQLAQIRAAGLCIHGNWIAMKLRQRLKVERQLLRRCKTKPSHTGN